MARKAISKKLRFEVFKRDAFTCQYCGKMAPDVVLEIDHINPVANGGDNDIMNLITSCYDCNRGKGKRKLTEQQEIKKQQDELKILSEKREQMKMMLQWKEGLKNLLDDMVDEIEVLMAPYNNSLTEIGRENMKKYIKQFGFMDVYEAFEVSLSQYASNNSDINAGVAKAINFIPKIINNKKKVEQDPFLKERYYIRAILKNRGMYYNESRLWAFMNEVCTNEEDCNFVKQIAKTCMHWADFWQTVNEYYLEGDGY